MDVRCSKNVTRYHQPGLQISLYKQTYVFPWCQFLFAEGGSDEIRVVFSTHDVVIKGSKLDKLFSEITAQMVPIPLTVPTRAESFGQSSQSSEPQISEITVSEAEQ